MEIAHMFMATQTAAIKLHPAKGSQMLDLLAHKQHILAENVLPLHMLPLLPSKPDMFHAIS